MFNFKASRVENVLAAIPAILNSLPAGSIYSAEVSMYEGSKISLFANIGKDEVLGLVDRGYYFRSLILEM